MYTVTIKDSVRDYEIIQQIDGKATIHLKGKYRLGHPSDRPIVSVYDEDNGESIIFMMEPLLETEGKLCGRWSCKFDIKAGKTFRIETGSLLSEANFDHRYIGAGEIIRGVSVGEVYIVSGQSNAVGFAQQPVYDPMNFNVRMRLPDGSWNLASHPVGYMNRNKDTNLGKNVDIMPGHSPWLAFGKLEAAKTGYPIGIIQTGKNGASIREWEKGCFLYKLLFEVIEETRAAHCIFYQGCTDVYDWKMYEDRLICLISKIKARVPDCRIVQISGTTNKKSPDAGWQCVRESQRIVALKLGIPLTATWDLNRYSDDIHLSSKDNLVLAERLSKYSKATPMPLYAERKGGIIEIGFSIEIGQDVLIPELILEDNQGNLFAPEKTEREGKKLFVFSKKKVKKIRPNFGALYQKNIKDKQEKYKVIPYFCFNLY